MAVLTQPLQLRVAFGQHFQAPRGVAGSRSVRRSLRVHAFSLPRLDLAEGPGTGLRHYPDPEHGQYEPRAAPPAAAARREHDLMSTEECYRLFPLVIHTSMPLRPHELDREPAGRTATKLTDAGPATGRRRRPAPADSAERARSQVLPYPATHPTDLRREWLARHHPEVLLLSQQRRAQA